MIGMKEVELLSSKRRLEARRNVTSVDSKRALPGDKRQCQTFWQFGKRHSCSRDKPYEVKRIRQTSSHTFAPCCS